MKTMTEDIARAAAQDAADRQMRAAGRRAWNEDDYNVACEEFERLWPSRHQMMAALDYRESDRRVPLEQYTWTRYRPTTQQKEPRRVSPR